MEGSNNSRRGVSNSRRGQIIHGGVKTFTDGGKKLMEGSNNSRRGVKKFTEG